MHSVLSKVRLAERRSLSVGNRPKSLINLVLPMRTARLLCPSLPQLIQGPFHPETGT